MNINKILTVLVAILSITGVAMYINVSSIDKEEVAALDSAVSMLVSYSFYLFIIVVLVAVLASLWGMLKNPAALKKTLLGLVALGVIFVISYILSSDAPVIGADKSVLAPQGDVSKWVGTGITYSIVLGAVAGFFFVWDLLKGLVKS